MSSTMNADTHGLLDQAYRLGSGALTLIAQGNFDAARSLLTQTRDLLVKAQSAPDTDLTTYVASKLANAIRIYSEAAASSAPAYDFVRVAHAEAVDVSCCTYRRELLSVD